MPCGLHKAIVQGPIFVCTKSGVYSRHFPTTELFPACTNPESFDINGLIQAAHFPHSPWTWRLLETSLSFNGACDKLPAACPKSNHLPILFFSNFRQATESGYYLAPPLPSVILPLMSELIPESRSHQIRRWPIRRESHLALEHPCKDYWHLLRHDCPKRCHLICFSIEVFQSRIWIDEESVKKIMLYLYHPRSASVIGIGSGPSASRLVQRRESSKHCEPREVDGLDAVPRQTSH